MKISDEWLPSLRALLAQVDDLEAELATNSDLVTPAQAAAVRLDNRIVSLNAEIGALASHRIPTDEERVAALVAGSDVSQVPPADIEARAQRTRILEGHRHQLTHDVIAVKAHAAKLEGQVAATTTKLRRARCEFALSLGDAVLHAYKAVAIAFGEDTLPTLFSTSDYVRAITGDPPDWADRVKGGIYIRWAGDETAEPDVMKPGSFKREMVNVWPRPDGCTISGKPVIDPEMVDRLVAQLRDRGVPEEGPRKVAGDASDMPAFADGEDAVTAAGTMPGDADGRQ